MRLASGFTRPQPALHGSTQRAQKPRSSARPRHRRCAVPVRAKGPKDVYVLDDGVIVSTTERKLFKGINNALKQCQSPWYVTSAHSAKQTGPLLTELTGHDFPEDSPRLLAGLKPPEGKTPVALRCVLSALSALYLSRAGRPSACC